MVPSGYSSQEKIGGHHIGQGSRQSLHVIGLLLQNILKQLPSYEESQSYADLYLISPLEVKASYDDPELRKCLSHESRLLHCSTREGLVHIAKHIGSDVVILGVEYSWAVEKLRGSLTITNMLMSGWIKQIVILQQEPSQVRREDNVIYTTWTTLQDILALIWDKTTDYDMPSSELQSLENRFLE